MFICTYRLWNYLEKKTNKKAAASSTGMLRLLVASFCVPLLSWYYIRPLCVHAQRPFYCVAYRFFEIASRLHLDQEVKCRHPRAK